MELCAIGPEDPAVPLVALHMLTAALLMAAALNAADLSRSSPVAS